MNARKLRGKNQKPRLSPAATDRPWRSLWDWLLAPAEMVDGKPEDELMPPTWPRDPPDNAEEYDL